MANPVIDRILYLIKEWKVALTELSRYKEDMGHIKDMYRLLKFKGKGFLLFFSTVGFINHEKYTPYFQL
jgi:hypothetical protein